MAIEPCIVVVLIVKGTILSLKLARGIHHVMTRENGR